jgi:hypothetical protein
LALSTNSPEAPAYVTRPDVKSLIFAEFTTNPPAILAPPLASIAAANVETPAVTLIPFLNVPNPTESIFVTS